MVCCALMIKYVNNYRLLRHISVISSSSELYCLSAMCGDIQFRASQDHSGKYCIDREIL